LTEKIFFVQALYDEMTDALGQIRSRIKICDTDYGFAEGLIEKPVAERLDWLSDK